MADFVAHLLPGPVSEIDSSIFSSAQFLAIPGPPGLQADLDEAVSEILEVHIQAAEPHPAYDDLPSFTLLFENGLV